MDWEELREKVKKELDIVEIISDYLPLKKRGNSYFARCPFHPDDTPSLSVSPSRGIWKCFGCNKGGDVISFVAEIEGISYSEALLKLAKEHLGIQPKTSTDPIQLALEKVKDFYTEELTKNSKAKNYLLKHRKIPAYVAREFEIGFADGDKLLEFAKKEGIEEILRKLGHIKTHWGSFDILRGRIVIPVKDEKGRIKGFTGRLIEDDKTQPKYLHTPYLSKGEILFGLTPPAIQAIREKQYLIIVEGVFDAIRLHSIGVRNAVAIFGTELSDKQIKKILWLRKRAKLQKVILAFDNDEAGKKAVLKNLKKLFAMGFEGVYNLSYKDIKEKDIDELISNRGIKEVNQLIDNALSIATIYKIARSIAKLEKPEEIGEKTRKLKQIIFSHPNKTIARLIYKRAISYINSPSRKKTNTNSPKCFTPQNDELISPLSTKEKILIKAIQEGLIGEEISNQILNAFPYLSKFLNQEINIPIDNEIVDMVVQSLKNEIENSPSLRHPFQKRMRKP